ncbi:sodium/hydrogen exchanger [Thecamonas trahens ATCC 50062]|uniref:Sodium/hydrogen exchanger n=1 Tax=Thecamonas trahens ATCC 50062 TaxID=461836 RepID=A0A0L0D9T8_THETB|nr:sodium/hydrogen exchanger [Thecamonas trahens ATCC 50062]KNC49015.1 sodium/hydrogen exchanger [Thecamonas trahens ATCC 50062]|eukprot:XP_013758426.1 sodium/hydrogen exchanger [Thecamonas trahens ATCC 50062]
MTEETIDLQTGLLTLLVLVAYIVSYLLKASAVTIVPPSGAVIVLGMLAGALLRWTAPRASASMTEFNSSVFTTLLLPPLIFESGFGLHAKAFFANLGSIMTFAIPGTIISTVVVGLFAWAASFGLAADKQLSIVEALLFGSLISATDPVSTLAIFHTLDADKTLDSLVFGESVMNDAVAIVLFGALLQYVDDPVTAGTLTLAFVQFVVVLVGSVVFGTLAAIALAFGTKHARLYLFPTMEATILLLTAFATYLLAGASQLSGITAVFAFGASVRHYAWYNLSSKGQEGCIFMFRSLAELAETVIFAYLGLSAFTFERAYEPIFIVACFMACLIGRAANVVPLSAALNCGRKTKITPAMQMVMWAAGLRGAVSYALALTLPTSSRPLLVATTHGVVVATIFTGGTMGPLLKLLGLNGSAAGGRPASSPRDGDYEMHDVAEHNSASRNTPLVASSSRQAAEAANVLGGLDGRRSVAVASSSARRSTSRRARYRSATAECWRSLDKRIILPLVSNKYNPNAPCHLIEFNHELELVPASLVPTAISEGVSSSDPALAVLLAEQRASNATGDYVPPSLNRLSSGSASSSSPSDAHGFDYVEAPLLPHSTHQPATDGADATYEAGALSSPSSPPSAEPSTSAEYSSHSLARNRSDSDDLANIPTSFYSPPEF